MIERLQTIATTLTRFRWLLTVFGLLCAALILLSLLEIVEQIDYDMLMPSIVGFCWAITLYSFSVLFYEVPAPPDSNTRYLSRLKIRIRRAAVWVLGALMIALTLSVIVLSYQLLRTWLMAN